MKDNLSAFCSFAYDEQIARVLPFYEEFHSQTIELVKEMNLNKPIRWLDTGCGTGKTACRALQELDGMEIHFTLCDDSSEMIRIAKNRLNDPRIIFRNIASQELDYDAEFDVVTAIQCHHYLPQEERKVAVTRCFHALKKDGIYITFENIRHNNKKTDAIAKRLWENYMHSNAMTQQQVQNHMKRRGAEVFPITIAEHIELLKSCGFKCVELLRFSYMQAGFFAIK